MRVVFMGTPDFAVNILENLIKNHEVILVVSQPDKPKGRSKELQITPIKRVALDNNIEVFQPERIKENYQKIIDLNPDVIVTCAYGQMIPEVVLKAPKYKSINIHSSLLPKYRGGAPMQRAIINGDKYTGITIMYMEKKMDSGNIIKQEKIEIKDDDNFETIHDKLSLIGANLIIEVLKDIDNIKSIPQNENEVTYAPIISRDEELLSFNDYARNIFNKVRGLSPFPSCYFKIDDVTVKVYKVSYEIKDYSGIIGEVIDIDKCIKIKCLDGAILLEEIQVSGKKRMGIKDFLNGQKIFKKGIIIDR